MGGDYQRQCPASRAGCLSFTPTPKTVIDFCLYLGNQPSETLLHHLDYHSDLLTRLPVGYAVPRQIISLLVFFK